MNSLTKITVDTTKTRKWIDLINNNFIPSVSLEALKDGAIYGAGVAAKRMWFGKLRNLRRIPPKWYSRTLINIKKDLLDPNRRSSLGYIVSRNDYTMYRQGYKWKLLRSARASIRQRNTNTNTYGYYQSRPSKTIQNISTRGLYKAAWGMNLDTLGTFRLPEIIRNLIAKNPNLLNYKQCNKISLNTFNNNVSISVSNNLRSTHKFGMRSGAFEGQLAFTSQSKKAFNQYMGIKLNEH